jgi:ReqiPepy6 Gp37-like protein
MDLYTLTPTFQRDKAIDEYLSLVWTERYSKNGDMRLDLPATPERAAYLAEGKLLGLLDSDEPMLIETQSVEKGIMTVVGQTIDTFFNQREIWIDIDPEVETWNLRGTPGAILATVVQQMLVSGTVDDGGLGIGGSVNAIPFLVVGDVDETGDVISEKLPIGPLYDAIQPIAETHKLGMKVFLSRSDAFGYELTFTVYKGVDRTSDQLENNLVQFSPALDSMTNIKELRSLSEYKTVAYVFPPSWATSAAGVAYAPGTDATTTGFDRRVIIDRASDITSDQVDPVVPGVTLASLLTQRAKDLLANNNFTKVVDGEVVPQSQYKYGTDYKLGDIVELKGQDNTVQKAQITEFIRSKDATGERAYPTVSVI